MLSLDGRAGGGQLLRTALSLSVLTGTPVEFDHVRTARPTPGLRPQHLAAVRVMAALCDADVSGATVGSTELTFQPGTLAPDPVSVDIGTAGSVTLLFDTVLPLTVRVETPFELTATGGTDVKWAPTIEYLARVKLPLLRRFGFALDVDFGRTGFYPAGSGNAVLHVAPSTADPIALDDRGDLREVAVVSKASQHLADAEVAERQARRVDERLEPTTDGETTVTVEYVNVDSPGSSLLIRAEYDRSVAGFDELGERGKPSEAVADDAVDRFLGFHGGTGAVDDHLADQLLVPLALAGGAVLAPRMTDHVESNVAVIRQFGFDVAVHDAANGAVRIVSQP